MPAAVATVLDAREHRLIALVLGGAFALATVVLGAMASPVFAVALPVGMAVACAIVLRPFLGVFFIVLLAQQGVFTQTVIPGVPLSGTDTLALLTVAGIGLTACRERRADRFAANSLGVRFAVLFLLVSCATTIYGGLQATNGLTKHAGAVLMLYLVVSLTRTERHVRLLVWALVISTAASAAIGVSDFALGTNLGRFGAGFGTPEGEIRMEQLAGDEAALQRRAGSANRSATASSHMMATGTLLALYLFLRGRRGRLVALGSGLLGASGTILTFARSGALALAVGGTWIGARFVRQRRFVVALVLAALAGGALVTLAPDLLWERFGQLAEEPEEDTTLQTRLGMTFIGMELLAQNPLIGIGPNTFAGRSAEFEHRFAPRGAKRKQLHNMYVSVAVEQGLVGFACFAGMLVVALRGLHRARKRTSGATAVLVEAVQIAFVSYLFACAFQPSDFYKFTWVVIGIALATGRLGMPTAEQPALPETARA